VILALLDLRLDLQIDIVEARMTGLACISMPDLDNTVLQDS
jgi:hypothetical protein